MRNPDQVMRMVETTAATGGRLDYLVSNAAINPLLNWADTTLADYDNIMDTNLRGTWVVCQAAAKQMIKEGHGGAICTLSSISAWLGAKQQTVYCATKAGISMMTQALSQVLPPHGRFLTGTSREPPPPCQNSQGHTHLGVDATSGRRHRHYRLEVVRSRSVGVGWHSRHFDCQPGCWSAQDSAPRESCRLYRFDCGRGFHRQ